MSIYCEENHPLYLKFNIFLSNNLRGIPLCKLRGILVSVYVSVYDKSVCIFLYIYVSYHTPIITSLQSLTGFLKTGT